LRWHWLAVSWHCAICDGVTSLTRQFPVFVLTTSAIVLVVVLLSQYWGGLAPCELCLLQRWPWGVAIVIAFIATMVGSRPALPWVALLLAAVFLISSALAFYHVGVEQHWFAGPTACTAPATGAETVEQLKTQLLRQQPVRCDEPAWTLLGVSLAGWNLLGSLVMTGCCFWAFMQSRGSSRRSGFRRGVV
jgi:disulfide bond formation protein DsbB